MKVTLRFLALPLWLMLTAAHVAQGQEDAVARLPPGVTAVWDASSAARETTPTREKMCINGLWRWQPARNTRDEVPSKDWGYFKVPGSWPGITDYMQKDSQTVFTHPNWRDERLGAIATAWYEREVSIPGTWIGRRIALSMSHVNSLAIVYVDGVKRGEVHFPGGELDLTAACRPGGRHVLSLLLVALPLKGVLLSYVDTNTAREVKGRVARRGLCGDVFLVSTPLGARIGDVKVETSFRRREITFDVALSGLGPERPCFIEARVMREGRLVKTFSSRPFTASDLAAGRIAFTSAWNPEALWDTHTPQNTYEVDCSLVETGGRVVDTQFGVRFGFREFWIDGRDFFLNGSRLQLSVVPLDNAQVGAALSTYAAARESLERLKSFGINFVYTHNYGCEPGSHVSFEEILRAADDVGMLVSFSQPHFSHYDWKAADADSANGYAQHAEFYVRVAQNHPAVVAYAMNHNATGYAEDMNPDLIDGIHDPRDARAQVNVRLALRAEAIVRRMDGSRIIYHHSSGNLGSMHTINFYPNFAPAQELSDWFEHWATTGVKPVFLCEYGAPFTWDWTMYRGWYKGERAFGSAAVPWQFCLAEWNAQFLGDRAFPISMREAANLRWEAKQLQADKVWHRWDYPHEVGSRDFDERFPVMARYIRDNWPAYRAWGVSAISPWEFGHYWKLREGVDRGRRELKVDWAHLQRPGLSPDYIAGRYERMDLAFERDDWVPTEAACALLRYNQPLLAYVAGKAAAFTSKDHVFKSGETVEKQLIVINNSREAVDCDATWSLALPTALMGNKQFRLAAGEQLRVPLRFELPGDLRAGEYVMSATVRFASGETQTDTFPIHVVAAAPALAIRSRVALFDPNGETAALLSQCGVRYQAVDASANLSTYDLLVVGKSALSVDGAAPDISRVRDGLKVLLFEQTASVLERRFGFRVAEYGLRQVFQRVPDHPALRGIAPEHLLDWRGDATILAPRLQYETRPRYGPTVRWCDLPVTRLWRCGNRGNVASVLIEKPPCGDFLPVIDGGYGLQYAPLLEHRDGDGVMVFCQLDVTGRTESDPVGTRLVTNLFQYLDTWASGSMRKAVYAGDPAALPHFAAAGLEVGAYDGGALSRDQVLILGPGAGRVLAESKPAIAAWLQQGGHLLAFGFDQADADALLPGQMRVADREYIASSFAPEPLDSPFAGIGSADVLNHDPRKLPLIIAGARIVGDGVLAERDDGAIVFCQLVPWRFDPDKQSNLKRTFRRVAYGLSRLLANQGVRGASPIIQRFHTPVVAGAAEKRWLHGLYLDQPEEWDDPYRFFRW